MNEITLYDVSSANSVAQAIQAPRMVDQPKETRMLRISHWLKKADTLSGYKGFKNAEQYITLAEAIDKEIAENMMWLSEGDLDQIFWNGYAGRLGEEVGLNLRTFIKWADVYRLGMRATEHRKLWEEGNRVEEIEREIRGRLNLIEAVSRWAQYFLDLCEDISSEISTSSLAGLYDFLKRKGYVIDEVEIKKIWDLVNETAKQDSRQTDDAFKGEILIECKRTAVLQLIAQMGEETRKEVEEMFHEVVDSENQVIGELTREADELKKI